MRFALMTTATESSTVKAAIAAQYTGGTAAVLFGLTPGEWQAVGVMAGIVLGLAGLLVNVYFKLKHLELATKKGAYSDV